MRAGGGVFSHQIDRTPMEAGGWLRTQHWWDRANATVAKVERMAVERGRGWRRRGAAALEGDILR